MCESVACNNFAVHFKRLASPGNFVLTSCVPAVTRIQLSNTQCPNLPVVLRLLYGSEVEAMGSDIYSTRVIDLTSHTVGTPLAGTAEVRNMWYCLETCAILLIPINKAISSVDTEINAALSTEID